VREMLSYLLIGIFALLFGFVVCVMVLTELERRSKRIAVNEAEAKRRLLGADEQPASIKH
jgi:hypothetical protein